MAERRPAEVFHPGEYLLDMLNDRGWTQTEFAEIIGRPFQLVNNIINKKRGITPDTAQEIAAALGTSAKLWMNLDTAYNLWKTQKDLEPIKRKAKLRLQFPVKELIRCGWLQSTENIEILESQILRFYEIKSMDERPKLSYSAATKRSDSENEEINSFQLAWLYRIKHIASTMQVPRYSPSKLKKALSSLEQLRNAPEQTRKVPELLEQSGVRFVIVEPIPSSKIDGVCFWLDDNSPVLGMTLRYDRIDNFWFVLRHEIEHILNEDGKIDAIIDSDIVSSQDSDELSEQEKLANNAAADFCVSLEQLVGFISRNDPYYSRKSVLGFAKRLGVHPGLVAGQLQWKIKRYDLFRNMLVSVRDYVTSVSMTDGYGYKLPLLI